MTEKQRGYGIVTLYGELGWPPYWKGATEHQLAILGKAQDALRKMSEALERIQHQDQSAEIAEKVLTELDNVPAIERPK